MLHFPGWKIALIVIVTVIGVLMALPNMLTAKQREALPGFMPSATVNLGLDLQGGVYLLLDVDPSRSVTKQMNDLRRDLATTFARGRGSERITFEYLRVEDDSIRIRLRDPSQRERAVREIEGKVDPVGGPVGPAGVSVRDGNAGELVVTFSPQKIEEIRNEAVRQTVAKLGPRLDPDGLGEISVQPQGDSRIIVEAPGIDDPQRLKDLIQAPGELTLNLVDDDPARIRQALETRPRRGFLLIPTENPAEPFILIDQNPIIEGEMLRSAAQQFDERNQPSVGFTLNTRGAKLFGDATASNVGQRFAIVLDGVSKSAPVIQTAILGGSGRITGNFTIEEAQDLATIIQAGALPADVTVIQESSVGPSLGQDSIDAGLAASLIGLALVAVFMIVAYGLFGIFGVTSLFVNIILILGVLSGLGATLTLPGIAGIILTIGMAVDANVLVFERIREEGSFGSISDQLGRCRLSAGGLDHL